MGTRKLETAFWQAYFDVLSRNLHGQSAEIEIAALALGNQVQAEWLPLLGISYDPRSEVLSVLLEGLDHMVHHPREIYADEGPAGLHSLLVIDNEGTRQIIRLREPLMLPGPHTAAS
jgi:hypothetical protein